MANGSRAGGAVCGEGSKRQSKRGGGRGKDIASSSAPSSGVVDKVPTPATDPSLFVPQPEVKQKKLQGEKEVWKHVKQGQEAVPKGQGEYWLRCRLCSTIYRGTSTRVVEHFLKLQKPCPFRTGEVLHKLVAQGAKVLSKDKKTQYLLQNYRQLHNISAGGAPVDEDDESAVVPRGNEEPQPLVATGREPAEEPVQRGKEPAAAQAVGEDDGASTTRMASMQQTTIKRWVENAAQKKLDVAWAEEMFRSGIAFQFLEFDSTQQLHSVYLEVANARPQLKLLSAKHIQTVMLEFIFMRIQKQVEPLTKCWDVTGCTFITDGSNDRRNFLAAGEQGAVLVATVYMDSKKKTGAALAKLWEKIMREIGLQRINAICTDNAEVNKRAAQILERRTDLAVARIPWVPCAAHCCSLLLRDISKLDWVKSTVKRGHTIVKFIWNHHTTNSFMMSLDSSLTLLRPTEVRFGSVYRMLERIHNRRAVLKDMVDATNVGKWKAMRWSSAKLQAKADLVYFTLRRDAWWTELRKVVEMMELLYLLLRRMDKDETAPSNLVEYDRLMERMLAEVVLTPEQRSSVLEKVRDRMKIMRQPVHALAFLLDPRRRDPKWLLDRDSALVQNALRYLQRQISGPWKSKAHVDIEKDLREFHKRPTAYDPKQKDKKMWEPDAVEDADIISPTEWWATYGGDVPKLQAIAIKVMGMWSTTTLAERNWSSMDLVQSKRRNRLKLATVEKLGYIHWNMNLLRASKNVKEHCYVDLWAEFFESLPDPEEGDDPLLAVPEEEKGKTNEDQARERALTKLPKGRIPKKLEDDEEEHTDDSDLEDEIWKGKAPWSESSSEGEADDGSDDDFELGAQPTIPGITYVGRRRTTQCHGERPPTTPCQGTTNTIAQYDIQSDVEILQTDTDIDMVLHPGLIDADEAEADRAKAMADADRERVQRRMREEEERRAVVPTRREMQNQKKKVGEHEPESAGEMGQHEEEEEEEMGQQDEEEEEDMGQQDEEDKQEMAHLAQEEAEMEEEEEEACMKQQEEVMKQNEGKGTDQQEEGLEDQHAKRVGESEEEQQHDEMAHSEEEPQQQQHAPRTVYKGRKKTAEPAGSPENSPEFPDNLEGSQHDNLWVSRVGRKRKAPPVDDVPRPKLPRGRPRKNKTASPATKPKKKKRKCKPRTKIVEDNPDSDSCSEHFVEDEGCTDD
ncbi:hypothetical protein CBR_g32297 [Chara braunii]|uniref:BED-type domain-containing protein n=1 Tax=Chara braunii TaxID=69332 RepID=A0A388JNA8_CHABU|nr:hypothetical protein CBR_g32297 [Chara braunii]|eukprot:GBG59284.1 hypothetical protein CBR_g32297 [Chara braunii]